jgi:hypothetical protein
MSSSDANKAAIAANRKKIFNIESNVCEISENINENVLGRMICPVQIQIKPR